MNHIIYNRLKKDFKINIVQYNFFGIDQENVNGKVYDERRFDTIYNNGDGFLEFDCRHLWFIAKSGRGDGWLDGDGSTQHNTFCVIEGKE